MKKFIITRLDRRHKGVSQFSHYIIPIWNSKLQDRLDFIEWRNWCWTTWGPGMERDMAIDIGSSRNYVCKWAWQTDKWAKRLYFQSEKELNWFVLTWSDQ